MVTIKDIAKVAGVSVTTVSRALNGYSDVNEKTRKKIEQVAKELKYSPNTLARSLVMNRSQTIGLLVSGFTKESLKDNFTVEVMTGVNESVSERGYDLVLFNTTSSKQREKTYTQLCRERRVDGVIIQGIRTDDPYLQEVFESNLPCVLIDIPVATPHVGYVTTDNVEGAEKAVQYLISLGHREIAMVNGHEFAFVSTERRQGYELAHQANQLSIDESLIVSGEFKEEVAYQQTVKLLCKNPTVTAIFCASDLMAIGVIKAIQHLGKRVPEDISVIGYDDILLASYCNPTLTTIAQDKMALGYEAANMLINMLEDGASPEKKVLETSLKVRGSTIANLKR